jgi:hypothetical protein
MPKSGSACTLRFRLRVEGAGALRDPLGCLPRRHAIGVRAGMGAVLALAASLEQLRHHQMAVDFLFPPHQRDATEAAQLPGRAGESDGNLGQRNGPAEEVGFCIIIASLFSTIWRHPCRVGAAACSSDIDRGRSVQRGRGRMGRQRMVHVDYPRQRAEVRCRLEARPRPALSAATCSAAPSTQRSTGRWRRLKREWHFHWARRPILPHLVSLHAQHPAVGRIAAARCAGVIGPPAPGYF